MRVIRKTSRDFVPKPWKNGLGVTREIHIHPEGANFETDNFLWRLSSADVTAGGPFSFFPGYDRSLFLLSGEGLDLELRGVKVSLAAPFSSIRFKGEDEVMCSLPGGPCTDFNIFCSRKGVSCEYRRIPVREMKKRLFLLGDWTVLFCFRGGVTAEWDEERADLGEMGLLVLEDYPADFSLTCKGAPDGEILLVTLTARD
jgi:environmental stress-induced protein Ves